MTCPSSNLQGIKQRIGRIRRVYDNKKKPLVIDFVDNLIYLLDKGKRKYILKYMGYKREKFYKELKEEYNRKYNETLL